MVIKQFFKPYLLGPLVVLAVAFFFRFYQIDQFPPGLFPDEATHALDALEVLDGQITLYSADEGSTGALWRYLLAVHFALFGPSILTLRILAGAVGVASVGMAYLLVRELGLAPPGIGDNRAIARPWNEAVAVIAALLLAVSYWHLDLSRIAFSAILMLLVQDAALFCLWRAVATGRRRWFLLFGLGVGLLIYNYLPGKLGPFMLLLFFFLNWLIAQREALVSKFGPSLLLSAGLALLTAGPLLLFALFNYQMLLARAAVPATGNVMPLSPWQGLVANLNVFGLWPAFWLSGRWGEFFLGPVLTVCFVGGVGVSLFRIKRPVYLFLLVWWLVMLLPGALASEGAVPHPRRAIGSATATYALAALGLAVLVFGLFRLAQRLPFLQSSVFFRRQKLVPLMATLLLGLGLVAWTGATTFRRYFVVWGPSEETKLTFHVYDLALAELMARESGPETVYLLPLDSSAGIVNPLLDTIDFVYRGQAAYAFLPDDEQTMLARLKELTADKQTVRLLGWNVTKHTGADPKKVAHYYLEKWGRQTGIEPHRYFDIVTYQLYNGPEVFTPPEFEPGHIDFEGQMLLTGYAFGVEYLPDVSLGIDQPDAVSVPAGNSLWIESKWRKIGDLPVDYQQGLWLEDQAGHLVARIDGPLLNNLWHRGPSQWPTGAQERSYYLLPVAPTTLPGRYQLKTVLYTIDDPAQGIAGRRLVPSIVDLEPDLAVTLGQVTIEPPLTSPDPAVLPISQRLDLDLGEGLRLLGVEQGLTGEALRPGDRATLGLWWQATQPLSRDFVVAIGMGNEEQTWSLSDPQPLGGADYPPRSWPAGAVVQTLVDIRLPAEVNTGEFNLGLRLLDAATGESLADWLLGQIQVQGRPRSFEQPVQIQEVNANFGNEITLLGYKLDLSQMEASGVVSLILYWQAQTEMEASYKVFVHLLDESGQIVTQVDRQPLAGEAPTTSWLEDEVIADAIPISVSDQLVTVSRVAIGLYHARSGERLSVLAPTGNPQSDQVIIDFNLQSELGN